MAVQARELMIGNYIYEIGIDYDSEGNKFLDSSDKDIIRVDATLLKQIEEDAVCYEPIPLTPEILKACGFEKDQYECPYIQLINGKLGIWLDDIAWIEHEEYGRFNQINVPLPHYLHQLQNLHYSLCGKELEINKELLFSSSLLV